MQQAKVRRSLLGLAVLLWTCCCTCHPVAEAASVSPAPSATMQSGYAPVDGIRMYYEIHGAGSGTPLVLLHGGGSSIDVTYGRILPFFAQHRRVIALDERAHGRSTDRDEPLRFDTSAEDVAALLAYLKVDRADVMGFSNGASVAMQLTLHHPELVRKLVFASSLTKKTGTSPQFWRFIDHATFADMPQPLKDAFLAVTPDPQKLRAMHDRDLERMQHFVETSDRDVQSIEAPTLVIAGDRDVPTMEHVLELTRLLPHARLLILPSGHGEYLGQLDVAQQGSRYPEWTAALIEQFLDGP